MTEKIAYGQCQRCAAYAHSPTYKCESCGTNYVELFPSPVSFESADASTVTQASQSSNVRPREVDSIGERFVSLVVCLAVAGIAAVPAFIFVGAAFLAQLFVCSGSSPSCGPHVSPVWVPFSIFAALGVSASLVVVVSLLLAVIQVASALKRLWPSHSR